MIEYCAAHEVDRRFWRVFWLKPFLSVVSFYFHHILLNFSSVIIRKFYSRHEVFAVLDILSSLFGSLTRLFFYLKDLVAGEGISLILLSEVDLCILLFSFL
jgi:hypothetical protein